MKIEDFNHAPGYFILAKMGKKVLRPGGKELTQKMVRELRINANDDVLEFAPGIGITAEEILKNVPKSYTGIEQDGNMVSALRKKITNVNAKIILGDAKKLELSNGSYDKVLGEAILTMQSDIDKTDLMRKAHRLLKKGGLYAIHELAIAPDNIDIELKTQIQRDLAHAIKVNAKPVTVAEWTTFLEKSGFEIQKIIVNDMGLLEPLRIIYDEGFFPALRIVFNIMTNTKARKRILGIREVFEKYKQEIIAVVIIAKKIN
jgi:ubiquinone/menaquinone biosynthesis C-methylase UbiE